MYVYFTHTKMWRIRANNSQRVKNTKCEYQGSTVCIAFEITYIGLFQIVVKSHKDF